MTALREHVSAAVGVTGAPRSLLAALGLCVLTAGAAYASGYAVLGFGLAAVPVLLAAVRWPIAPLVVTFVLAGVFGGRGGHWKAPVADLPIFELLLAAGALGAFVRLVRGWSDRSRSTLTLALAWLPAACYGLLLVAFLNQRDLVSGVREAIILVYPLLIALPIAVTSAGSVRAFVERRGWYLILAVALAATLTGVINLAIDNTVETSSGQTRSLSGEYAGGLAAGILTAVWLAVHHHRFAYSIVLGAVSLVGLLLINSRSAYLAILIALVVLALASGVWTKLRLQPKRVLGAMAAVTLVLASVLALTPLGQDGVARFGALFESSDDNYSFRERALSRALGKEDAGEVILGEGVGLQETDLDEEFIGDLSEGTLTVRRLEAHNSYATIYQRAGIIGGVLFLVPLLFLIRTMIRVRDDPIVSLLLSLTAFTAVMATFNVVLENSFSGIWFWVPLLVGGMLALETIRRRPRSTEPSNRAPVITRLTPSADSSAIR